MVSSGAVLELLLLEMGNKLIDPPSSVDELLPLLDKAEGLLSRVEQSPLESIQDTLPSFVKALMADKLFTHSDEDVKVGVASCITEITRITAPDAPYEDDQMKDAFRLIVSTFEKLHDKSSRSYAKRTSILETVARVRSCVVMLDLECEDLILEMFQHFLKTIREYHPKSTFESMVTIMSLIIEESEDVSPDLLSCLLACVRKDKKEVSSISQALAEEVLKNSASTLKSCIWEVLQSLGSTLDDYGDVVQSICRDSGAIGMNQKHATGEHKVDKHVAPRVNPSSQSPKLRKSNVIIHKKESDSVSSKEGRRNQSSRSKSDATTGAGIVGRTDNDDVNRKRKGRQFDGSQISRKKGAKKFLGNDEEHEDGNMDDELPPESKKKPAGETLLKAEDREKLRTELGSKSMVELVGNLPKKRGRKKTEKLEGDVHDGAELFESELKEISDSEAKSHMHSCIEVSAGDSVNKSNNIGDVSSIKKQKNKNPLYSEKESSDKGVEKIVVKEKEKLASVTPKTKGKGTQGKKSFDVKVYGAELVGFPIRVWWPQDRQFYEGVVDSFDSGRKKHKVVYNDGDEENLNLQKEKWEFVKEPTGSDQEEALNDGSADASPELPLKKRVKRGMEASAAKKDKKEVMSKRGGDTSGKGKGMALKSGQKTGVGSKSGGKSVNDSKNDSKDPPVQNGKRSDDVLRRADRTDGSEDKPAELYESNDGDLLSLKTSIKSKGRAGKTKKMPEAFSQEDVPKDDGKPEKVESETDGLENQKDKVLDASEDGRGKEDTAAEREDEPNNDESLTEETARVE